MELLDRPFSASRVVKNSLLKTTVICGILGYGKNTIKVRADDNKPSKEGDMQMDKKIETLKIDYSLLMDLRVDYAFKIFAESNPNSLISLLNAIFANKKIKRVIKSIIIKNPYLDKKSVEDKLSILDVRAELDDGTTILIEMHM